MTTLFEENACLRERHRRSLAQALRPISADLQAVEECLARTLRPTEDPALETIFDFLLGSPGKRIRPALVLLSARAVAGGTNGSAANGTRVKVAAAVELIHMASLVHDDLIDGATIRHHRPSVNACWGGGISVALGDHLCAKAFGLIADCEDPHLFAILGSGLCAMCEGELSQVVARSDFALSERRCLAVIEKKTAALFRVCCHAGAWIAGGGRQTCEALQRFGFHFGVAFQILDDCRDLLGDQRDLGKTPGQDWLAGDVTLPLLYGIRCEGRGAEEPLPRDVITVGGRPLARLHAAFRASQAPVRIGELAESHLSRAAQELQSVGDSDFRNSLQQLADHITMSVADILAR